jgi:hypothetical protein
MNDAPRRRPAGSAGARESAADTGRPPRSRAGLGAVAVLLVAAGVGAAVWPRVAALVAGRDEAILVPDAIELRGKAPWVKADIRAEALRASSLDQPLPLHDPELPVRLARAFDMHPWVRRVVRVDVRHPAAATVEVECREPVAMVGVDGGLLAVDAEGYVLPSADFTAESAAGYPRLTGIGSSPQGPEGALWGDAAVEEGATLARVIGPEWGTLGLVECRPAAAEPGSTAGRAWELVDGEGRVIRFGSAPGRESVGEPSAAAKVARLQTLGSGGDRGAVIDLSAPEGPGS